MKDLLYELLKNSTTYIGSTGDASRRGRTVATTIGALDGKMNKYKGDVNAIRNRYRQLIDIANSATNLEVSTRRGADISVGTIVFKGVEQKIQFELGAGKCIFTVTNYNDRIRTEVGIERVGKKDAYKCHYTRVEMKEDSYKPFTKQIIDDVKEYREYDEFYDVVNGEMKKVLQREVYATEGSTGEPYYSFQTNILVDGKTYGIEQKPDWMIMRNDQDGKWYRDIELFKKPDTSFRRCEKVIDDRFETGIFIDSKAAYYNLEVPQTPILNRHNQTQTQGGGQGTV